MLRTVIIIVVIGGQRRRAYASLAACHCMLFYVRCMLIDTWQINSFSLSLSLSDMTDGESLLNTHLRDVDETINRLKRGVQFCADAAPVADVSRPSRVSCSVAPRHVLAAQSRFSSPSRRVLAWLGHARSARRSAAL